MNRRIAYFGHHGSTELLIRVHAALAGMEGVDAVPSFVLFNSYWRRRVMRRFPTAVVTMLPNRFEWRRLVKAGAGDASSIDDGFERGWKLDKMLRFKSADEVRPLWRETRRRLSAFLDEARPEIVASELIQSMDCYAFFLECQRRKIPYVQMCASRIRGGMEYYLGTECLPAFIDLNAAPSERSMEIARATVAEVRAQSYSGPGYMKIQKKPGYFRWKDVKKTWDYLSEQFQGGLFEPNNKPFWHPFVSKFRGRKKYAGEAYREYCVEAPEVKAISGKKLLFPLHVTPEASTDLWSPRYADMAKTARMIVDQLPDGWTLVMKEHPAALYIQRSAEDIRALRSVPRSVIVSPSTPNDWLLKNTNAAIVVTGTFALETIMRGLPVMTLGRPFYDLSGQTIPIADLRELPAALEKAQGFRVDDAAVLHLIACYADAVDPGLPVNTQIFPTQLTDENARNIAAGLHRRFFTTPVRAAVAS